MLAVWFVDCLKFHGLDGNDKTLSLPSWPGFATPAVTFEDLIDLQNVSDGVANPVTLRSRLTKVHHSRHGDREVHDSFSPCIIVVNG